MKIYPSLFFLRINNKETPDICYHPFYYSNENVIISFTISFKKLKVADIECHTTFYGLISIPVELNPHLPEHQPSSWQVYHSTRP
jgi:hypothetical protein